MNVLVLGDIFVDREASGGPTSAPAQRGLEPELIVANGENAAGGFGLTKKVAEELFRWEFTFSPVVTTSGTKRRCIHILVRNRILRPANYPPGVPGSSVFIHRSERLGGRA